MTCKLELFHDLGSLVRVTAEFRDPEVEDSELALLDPTSVTVKVKRPLTSPQISEYVYGVDGDVKRESVGRYYIDVDANESGRWTVRFESTGEGQAASEESFRVNESAFV